MTKTKNISNTDKLKSIISTKTGVKPSSISEGTTFDQLKIDEFDVIDLIMTVEDEFDIIISDNNSIQNVGDLINQIA